MRISEAIASLQNAHDMFGDVDLVELDPRQDGQAKIIPVTRVEALVRDYVYPFLKWKPGIYCPDLKGEIAVCFSTYKYEE